MSKLSVIIPVYGNDPIRIKNFKVTLDALNAQTSKDFEIIVVEQTRIGDNEGYYQVGKVDKYYKLRGSNNDMNISWCLNYGVKNTKSPLILTTGADIVMNPDFIENVINFQEGNKKKFFITWNKMFRLNEKGVDKFAETGALEDVVNIPEYCNHITNYDTLFIPSKHNAMTGVMVITRNFYHEFGGFNENFFGWGHEDNEKVYRMMQLTGEFVTMEQTLAHLSHSRGRPKFPNKKLKEIFVKDWENTIKKLKSVRLGSANGPTLIDVPGIPRIYFYNLNVGSGIERTGDTILDILTDYYPYEYKAQNPPYIMVEDLHRMKPDIIIMNEIYGRVLEAVGYYKILFPKTKVILLNHCHDHLVSLPMDVENGWHHRDGNVMINNLFRNYIDVIINLNHHPPEEPYPDWLKNKVIDAIHPVHHKFGITKLFEERKKDFFFYGNLLPHKISEEFMERISKTDIVIDVYGKHKYEKEHPEYYKKVKKCKNLRLMGFVEEKNLIEVINSYRFLILPHQGYEPFNLTIAEAVRCGCIPLIVNDRNHPRAYWLDWAEGLYVEYQSPIGLIEMMKYIISAKSDSTFIEELSNASKENSMEMTRKTAQKVIRETLIKLFQT